MIALILVVTILFIILDFIEDYNLNTTYYVMQAIQHFLFQLRIENMLCSFHLYKQFVLGCGYIAKHLDFQDILALIVITQVTIHNFYQLINKIDQSIHGFNFLDQYKNSTTLHIDTSKATLAIP
jgi:hypothetical protein